MVPSAVLTTPAEQAPDTSESASRPSAPESPASKPERSADSPPPAEPSARRWRPLIGVIPALLLLSVGIWEIRAARSAGADIPNDKAWARAALNVRARYLPGELIVVAPHWLDPVVRMHLGDLMPVERVARMDDARFAAVWELSIRGDSAPESRGRQVAFDKTFNGIRLRRLTREPARVVTDFVARFDYDGQRVRVEGKAARRPRVGLHEVGFAPRRCIMVEPRPDQTVRVTFRGVPLGSTLVGYAGLADVFTRRDIRSPGRLQVFMGDTEATSVEFGVDDGWVRFSAPTEPGNGDVTFALTAVGPKARKRLICFAAEARE